MFLPSFLRKGDLWKTTNSDTSLFSSDAAHGYITTKEITLPYYKDGAKQGEKTFYSSTRTIPASHADIGKRGKEGSAPLQDHANRRIFHEEGIITEQQIPSLTAEQMDVIHKKMIGIFKELYELEDNRKGKHIVTLLDLPRK